jgi:hypothetical protein
LSFILLFDLSLPPVWQVVHMRSAAHLQQLRDFASAFDTHAKGSDERRKKERMEKATHAQFLAMS